MFTSLAGLRVGTPFDWLDAISAEAETFLLPWPV